MHRFDKHWAQTDRGWKRRRVGSGRFSFKGPVTDLSGVAEGRGMIMKY